MSDQDQDALEPGEPNEFMPGDEEFEDELEAEEEGIEPVPARTRAQIAEDEKAGRRFRFGRGAAEEAEHPQGSLRTTHERVRVEDRLSAIFALVCAIGLVGILVLGFLGQYAPKGGSKPLPTLGLQTFVPTPSPSGSESASGSPTLAPTATPAPSAS
jgi:hypothetical protein